jgi:hypothetical protein
MAEVVNLRTIRKQRTRAAERTVAAEHAARHGQGKAERQRREAEAARADAHLDGHLREARQDPGD